MSLLQVLHILWARKLIIIASFASAVFFSILVVQIIPKSYTAASTLILDLSEPDPVTDRVMPLNFVRSYIQTQIQLIKSARVSGEVVDSLNLTQSPSFIEGFMADTGGEGDLRYWIGRQLVEDLEVFMIPGSNVLAISYSSVSPRFAAAVANAFANAYMLVNLELKVDPSRRNAQWFGAQLNNLRQALEDSQNRLVIFQQRTGIVSASIDLNAENATQEDLTARLTVAQAEASNARSLVKQLETFDRLRKSGTSLPTTLMTEGISRRRDELDSIESELASISGSLGVNHPEYKALVARRSLAERVLAEEIAKLRRSVVSQVELADTRVKTLSEELDSQAQNLLLVKQDRDRLDALLREVEIRKAEYDNAFRRASTLRLEGQASHTAVAIMEEAVVPIDHSFPKKTMSVMLASAFGFVMGVALAFITEMFDRRIRIGLDIEQATGHRVLVQLDKAKFNRKIKSPKRKSKLARRHSPDIGSDIAAAE